MLLTFQPVKFKKMVSALKPALLFQINILNHKIMKSILLIICVLLVSNIFAQEKYLSISDSETGKEVIYKQNKRVRVKTIEGGKLNGKLKIMNDEQVMIKNIIIPVTSIEKIKNNPLALNILVSASIIFVGGFTVFYGIYAIAWGVVGGGIIISGVGVGMVYAGILSPNVLPAAIITANAKIKVKTGLE